MFHGLLPKYEYGWIWQQFIVTILGWLWFVSNIHDISLTVRTCNANSRHVWHPSIHLSLHPSIHHSIIHLFIHPCIHASIHPSIPRSIYSSILNHSPIHLFIHQSIHPFIYLFIHLFIQLSIHSFRLHGIHRLLYNKRWSDQRSPLLYTLESTTWPLWCCLTTIWSVMSHFHMT